MKDSVKWYEKNDNLSLTMKSNCAKAGCDELVKKLKIKQRIFFTFLLESIKEDDVDIEGIDDEPNDKYEFYIRRKESEE